MSETWILARRVVRFVQTGWVRGVETIREATEHTSLPGFPWVTQQTDVQRIEYIHTDKIPEKWKQWDEVADVEVAVPFTWIAIEHVLRQAGVQKVEFLSGHMVKITHNTGIYSAGDGFAEALTNFQHVTRNILKEKP